MQPYSAGAIAQLVEQRTENPCVPGSIPGSTTTLASHFLRGFFVAMKFFVYILQSSVDGRFYIGQTQNIKNRLTKHNMGHSKSTKPYAPWNIVWFTPVDSRSKAVKLERKLKNLKSRRKIILYIDENPCVPGSENVQISDLIHFRESS